MINNIKIWMKKYNSYLRFGIDDYSPVLKDGLIAFFAFILGLFVVPNILVVLYFLFPGHQNLTSIPPITSALIQIFSELPICLVALLFIKQFWEKISLLRFKEEWINFLIFTLVGIFALILVEDVFSLMGNGLYSLTHHGAKLPRNSSNENSLDNLKNANLFLYLLLVIFVGPISEEIGTRLGIMNLVNRKWINHQNKNIIKWSLFMASSLLFGLMHVVLSDDYWHAFPYIGSGLVFSSIYAFSGYKIHYSISVHLSTNLIATIMTATNHNSILILS